MDPALAIQRVNIEPEAFRTQRSTDSFYDKRLSIAFNNVFAPARKMAVKKPSVLVRTPTMNDGVLFIFIPPRVSHIFLRDALTLKFLL